jgi:small subunit ribosomal protein S14
VAKMALIERELKRDKLVAKYAKKHAELKAIARDAKRSEEERAVARLGCRSCRATRTPPASATVAITGRPRGTFQHFGLARAKIREMAFAGEIPGVVKASW